jgi:hypothetical protein
MGTVREEAKARGLELTPTQKGHGITKEIWSEYCQEP